jgi:hypothetical protein
MPDETVWSHYCETFCASVHRRQDRRRYRRVKLRAEPKSGGRAEALTHNVGLKQICDRVVFFLIQAGK